MDCDGIIRRVNRAECRLLGLPREDIVGKPAWCFVTDEERDRYRVEVLQTTLRFVATATREREYVSASGERLLVELHENLIYHSAGEIAGIRTAMLDVTERKQRQVAEAESAEIRSILERIGDAYIAFDTEWRYTYVNGKAAELARKPASELIGRCVWDEFPESVHTPFYTELHRALREQIPIQFDNTSRRWGSTSRIRCIPALPAWGVLPRRFGPQARSRGFEDTGRLNSPVKTLSWRRLLRWYPMISRSRCG